MALLDRQASKKADVELELSDDQQELAELAPEVTALSKAASSAKTAYEKARGRYFELLTQVTGNEGGTAWLNPVDGMVYQRTAAKVGAGFDAARFREENPDFDWLIVPTGFQLDEEAAQTYVTNHPEFLKVLQAYALEGHDQLRVGKPRKATIEELATGVAE